MTHFKNRRAMTVDAKTTYVVISRARHHVTTYTDSHEKLADAIELRSGEREAAIASTKTAQMVLGRSSIQRIQFVGFILGQFESG